MMWTAAHNRVLRRIWVPILVLGLVAPAAAQESELLAVLRSDASVQEKSAACRQLARVATPAAVPALAALLGDEHLSHMARYALETIDDPSVDDALRAALGTVQGLPRAGVIGSLGVRRDRQAVPALAALLTDPDTDVAQGAARALGCIGTGEAARALEQAAAAAQGTQQRAVAEGLLRCAEALAQDGQGDAAREIYDGLRRRTDAPAPIRAAALRGAIVIRGSAGSALLAEALRSADDVLAAAAMRSAMEVPGAEVTATLVAALPDVPPARQGLVILALADRREPQVLPTVLDAAEHADAPLRLVAIRALRRVGDASCLPALLDVALQGSDEMAQAAKEALESLQDEAVDQQLVERLAQADGKLRMVLIDLATRRRAGAAAEEFWRATTDQDPAVRRAAWKGLGTVLDTAAVPRLISRLAAPQDNSEATALDQALRDIARRASDRDQIAAQLTAALAALDGPVQIRVLDILGAIGGTTALDTVAAAARGTDDALRDAAFRVLGQWNSIDSAPVLLDLFNATSEERFRTRAIRAYIRLARQFDMPADRRAEMCRAVLRSAARDADKRLVLEVLLRYPNQEMAALAMEAAENPALKDEALLVMMGMADDGVNRDELGRALAQAGQKPVQVELIHAEYGAGDQVKDVTAALRQYVKNYRIIILPNASYNESLGGDPAPNIPKQLKIKYRIDGKEGEVTLSENAIVVLPLPN